MGRVLVIGSGNPVTHTIVDLLSTAGVPVEFAAGPVAALQCMRARSFAITITPGKDSCWIVTLGCDRLRPRSRLPAFGAMEQKTRLTALRSP